MVANVSFNPIITTNAGGSFNVESTGYIQGCALDMPAVRYQLKAGVLSSSETIPMWGGVGIYNNVPSYTNTLPNGVLGTVLGRATALTGSTALTGFSVFDQNHSAIQSPQSPVPLAGSAMSVNYYLLGSLAEIPVACDPALAGILDGTLITSQVAWDFTNQMLIPYLGTLTISSGTYNNTTGLVTLVMSAAVTFSAGDSITIASLTGTGAYASLNGTFTALTASGTSVTYNPGAALGAATITGGNMTVGGTASQALGVKVLDVNVGNSMTVAYSASTGFATWNRAGSCALIKI